MLTLDGNRSLSKKLLGSEPRQKYVWLYIWPLRLAGKLLLVLVYVHQPVLGGRLQGTCPLASLVRHQTLMVGTGQTPFTSTGPSNYGMPPNGYQTPHRPPFSGQAPAMSSNLNATHPVWNQ